LIAPKHAMPPSTPFGLGARVVACSICASLALLAVPAEALAAPPDDGDTEADEIGEIDTEAKAMTAYNDGKDAYDQGDYGEALQLFLEAQSLYPSPVFHYNVGLCHEALGNHEQAIISFSAYLRSYKSAFGTEPEDKVNTENKISRLEQVVENKKAKADADAEAAKNPVFIAPPVVEPEPKRPPGFPLIVTGAVLMGVGVGLVGFGGAYFGTQAAGFSTQIDDIYTNGNPDRVSLAAARAIDTQGSQAQTNQIVMMTLGGALGVTGVALLIVGLSKNKKAKHEKRPEITPTAGPSGAGILIRGRF